MLAGAELTLCNMHILNGLKHNVIMLGCHGFATDIIHSNLYLFILTAPYMVNRRKIS